jgi:hypothetical protein
MADVQIKTPPLPATTSPSAPAPADMTIPDLAKAINDRLSAIAANTRNTLQRSIEIGDLLLEAKERVGHGNFEAWLLDHCQLSFRSARRYMKFAKERTQIEAQAKSATLADLSINTAQRLLAPPKSPGQGGGSGPSKPPVTEQYKSIENDLIACLKELREKAESYAANTIEALNDTVSDIKSMMEQAQAKRMQ